MGRTTKTLDDLGTDIEAAYERWERGDADSASVNPLWRAYIESVAAYETAMDTQNASPDITDGPQQHERGQNED